MDSTASLSPSSETSAEIYNEPCERRIQLLGNLSGILDHAFVTPAFWAVLMLADLEMLEKFVINVEKSSYPIEFCQHACTAIPIIWRQKGPEPPCGNDFNMFSESSEEGPDKTVAIVDKVKERDGNVCIIRQTVPIQASHIYPHCLLFGERPFQTTPPFWEMVRYFWTPSRVSEWQREVQLINSDHPLSPRNSIANMLCLAPDLNQMWADGLFALRPLDYNEDKTELTIQFFWQPAQKHGVDDKISLMTEPGSSRNLDGVYMDHKRRCYCLLLDDNDQIQFVKTGRELILKTSDPENLPLPSKTLLEMAFILSRIVNLSGIAKTENIEKWMEGSS